MALIDIRDVRRSYSGTLPTVALDGVSITIEESEFVAIVGPSGSGKSTLLNIIAMLDRQTEGVYLYDGENTDAFTQHDRSNLRSRDFGFVFQSFHLLDGYSAVENVALSQLYTGTPRSDALREARDALSVVGLSHRANHLASQLSGGERQRVAIARALVGGARIIVADEPTGNLDTEAGRSIVELLLALARSGATVVLVTHDAEVATRADRTVELRDGRIRRHSKDSSVLSSVDRAVLATTTDVGAPKGTHRQSQTRARWPDLLRDALRATGSRRGRAVGLVLSVALSVGLVVATLGLSQTASAQVSDRFDARRNREVTVYVRGTGSPDSDVVGTSVGFSVLERLLPPDTENRVRQIAGTQDVGILADADSQAIRVGWSRTPVEMPFMGVSPGLLGTAGADVEWLAGHRAGLGPREVLVGVNAVGPLNLPPLETQPSILINDTPFSVAGYIHSTHRSPELMSAIVGRWDEAASVGGAVQLVILVNTDAGAARQVGSQIPIALDPVRPERFEAHAPGDPRSLRADIESDIRIAMLALSGVVFLASIAGIANVSRTGVIARIGEFGLRRALGARRSHVLVQVFAESAATGIAGGIAGLYVGLLGTLGVTIANGWHPVLDLRTIPIAVVGGAVAGILGGAAAAISASQIEPIDALRR